MSEAFLAAGMFDVDLGSLHSLRDSRKNVTQQLEREGKHGTCISVLRARYSWLNKKPIRGDYLKGNPEVEPGIFTGEAIVCAEYTVYGGHGVTAAPERNSERMADILEDTDSE